MKNLTKIVLIVFVLLNKAIFSMPFEDPQDALLKATAIMWVEFYDKNKEFLGYQGGTAFFINDPEDCLLASAFHVVNFDPESLPENVKYFAIYISYGYSPGENFKKLKNITKIYPLETNEKYWEVDIDNDLIVFNLKNILKFKPAGALKYITKSKDLPDVGDPVYTMGHPELLVLFNYAEGKVTAKQNNLLITNFPNVAGGNSGGAVINEDNKVSGVLVARVKNGVAIQIVIPSIYLYPLVYKLEASEKGEFTPLEKIKYEGEFKQEIYKELPDIFKEK